MLLVACLVWRALAGLTPVGALVAPLRMRSPVGDDVLSAVRKQLQKGWKGGGGAALMTHGTLTHQLTDVRLMVPFHAV